MFQAELINDDERDGILKLVGATLDVDTANVYLKLSTILCILKCKLKAGNCKCKCNCTILVHNELFLW